MTVLDLRTTERAGVIHVELSGELDIATAPKLEDALQQVEAARPSLIAIDLRGLEFMDSSGLRALISADTRARKEARRLVLVRGSERVQRVLSITRLDERLEIVDDVQSLAGAA